MNTLQLRVTQIRPLVDNAILISLQEVDGATVNYQAGQFLTFIINLSGTELRRSYSICSTPGIDKEMTILVKRITNGAVSRFLIDHLRAGDVLESLPPAGRFTLDTSGDISRTVFFLAAGSGITPVYSLVKKLLFEEPLSNAILIFQNRDEHAIIFKDELDSLQHKFKDRFQVIHLLSNPTNKHTSARRLNNSLLEKLLVTYLHVDRPHDFYLCGPLSFMRMIQFVLRVMGVSDEHIRKENFVIDAAPSPPVMQDTSLKEIVIRWKDKIFEFPVQYPDTILQAALKNNVHLPYSCRAGRCSSCIMTCISGKVKMSVNEVLTTKDLEVGLVLTCVGFAETDLVLEL